jgi:polar amino acid transport system substrate-binding protein
MKRRLLAAAVLGSLLLAACGDDSETADTAAATTPATDAAPTTDAPVTSDTGGTGGPGPSPAAECAAGKTLTDGVLTVATGEPAFPPYVIDDQPETGEGFEAAVAYAVATEMGFAYEDVAWTRTAFDAAIAPGPKDFDFNLQQISITDERKQAVDFSDVYYTAPQAIFGIADNPAANAKTLADLQALKIGVASGTTSVTYVEETIKPTQEPFVFADNAAAKQALESGQIDAIVSDLPTAIYITNVEIEGTKVYGQIEGSGTDEFGLLLAKDSPLTECVNLALAAIKDSGELDAITTKWMSEYTEAPVISL